MPTRVECKFAHHSSGAANVTTLHPSARRWLKFLELSRSTAQKTLIEEVKRNEDPEALFAASKACKSINTPRLPTSAHQTHSDPFLNGTSSPMVLATP